RDYKSFVMADIPGIIEGAAEGKGLGHRFLRHIERNALLLFLIPCDTKDIIAEYNVLLSELEKFNPELLDKRRLLAITKSDMLDEQMMEEMRALLPHDLKTLFISAVTQTNIDQLKDTLWEMMNKDQEA
ncbi:MAG: GTPase ObgE, partial [Bacteroidetes bacterium]|nr:GTPase ObgE [Bacteroidota bacterium]